MGRPRGRQNRRDRLRPSRRLFALVEQLSGEHSRGKHFQYEHMSLAQSWELVNELCREIWGRTAIEEMKEDYRWEGRFLEQMQGGGRAPVEVSRAYADYHALRGTLIEMLERSPETILDTSAFCTELLPRLQPLSMLLNSGGIDGEVSDDLDLVHGYYDDKSNRASGWWWAASPRRWPRQAEGTICLKARDEWISIASTMAPMAKLMLHGRAHRTMIGPEIFTFERRMAASGVNIRIDAQFQFPREDARDQMETFYLLAGGRALHCDMCRKRIVSPEGRFLQPWLFRHNEVVAKIAVVGLTPAGAGQDAGQRKFWKDWSYWTCCDGCFTTLSGYPAFAAAWEATSS